VTHVNYETKGAVAVISLDRVETRNAQNAVMLDELDEMFDKAAVDPDVRVIVLRANGPHFSSGHDIGASGDRVAYDETDPTRMVQQRAYEIQRYIGYSRKWRDLPKPTIAAVQGACIAGGLLLCWPMDLIIAADNAFFSDPVVYMGVPGVEYHGHTWEFGPRKAKEMLFTGMRIDAEEAHRLGMVNRVVPVGELDDRVMELANQIAEQHPFALALTKRVVNQVLDIQGQYASQQMGFDMHWLGHANALVETGYPILVREVSGMKEKTGGNANG
jgi:enoyl-CoA hydratase